MENLGQYLQTVRNSKNINMEEVVNDLRLTMEQVTAIESNRLDNLGNYGCVRAMVFTYIRYLEADEKLALNLFEEIWPSQKQKKFIATKPIKEKTLLISVNLIWLIGIILIIIVLGAIIWTSYKKGYLNRPFDVIGKETDSVQSGTAGIVKQVKPDTVRAQMQKVMRSQFRLKDEEAVSKDKKTKVAGGADPQDTTDYVDEMIFDTQESPFNPRF